MVQVSVQHYINTQGSRVIKHTDYQTQKSSDRRAKARTRLPIIVIKYLCLYADCQNHFVIKYVIDVIYLVQIIINHQRLFEAALNIQLLIYTQNLIILLGYKYSSTATINLYGRSLIPE